MGWNNSFGGGNSANSMWKLNAYREVATNYDVARDIIYQKNLAYGEAAIVPFYYPDRESEEEERVIKNLVGIGALNGDVMFISDINDSNIDDSIVTIDGVEMTVKEAFEYVLNGSGEKIVNAIDRMNANMYEVLGEIRDALGGNKTEQVKETIFSNPALYPESVIGNRYSYEWIIDTSSSYINQKFYISNIMDVRSGEVVLPNVIYNMDSIVVRFSITMSDDTDYYFENESGKLRSDVFRAIVIASCARQDSSASSYEQLLGMIDEIHQTDDRQDGEISDNTENIEEINTGVSDEDIDSMFDNNTEPQSNEN